MNSQHIAIIGAGLLGRLTALALVEQGYRVTLMDKDHKNGRQSAAYAAAGLLTPLGEAMHSDANIVEMGFESLQLWPQILAKLDGFTYFQQAGTLMVSHEVDHGEQNRFIRYIQNHYSQYQLQQLNREQLLQLEPELGRSFNQGIYMPEEGQIGNRKLLQALQLQIEKSNILWLEQATVTSIKHTPDVCSIVYQKADKHLTLKCDISIDCRGIGASINESHHAAKPLADLRGVRGELFQLFAPEVHLNRPIRLMHPRYQLYIAPKPKGFYVVGATEIESEDRSPMTVRSSLELLSAAYSVHPGFAEANIREQIVQLRPAFNDNKPQIAINERLIQANGLYRHGFLIAPVVVEQILHAVALFYGNSSPAQYQHLLPIRSDHAIIH